MSISVHYLPRTIMIDIVCVKSPWCKPIYLTKRDMVDKFGVVVGVHLWVLAKKAYPNEVLYDKK